MLRKLMRLNDAIADIIVHCDKSKISPGLNSDTHHSGVQHRRNGETMSQANERATQQVTVTRARTYDKDFFCTGLRQRG